MWRSEKIVSPYRSVISSLEELDEFAVKPKIGQLIDVSIEQLEFQLAKGRASLLNAKKKAYYKTLTGSILYWISVLFGVSTFL